MKVGDTGRSSRRFWAVYAAVYDIIWDSPVSSDLAALVAGTARGAPSDTAIDLGCGTGLLSGRVRGVRVGVDSSPEMLRRAVQRGRIDTALVADAAATGLAADPPGS